MVRIFKITGVCFFLLFAGSLLQAQTAKYRCMVQMTNYTGEGAYIAVSLVNAKGQYVKTLAMMGPDKEWQETLKSWYSYQAKKPEKLNAVTGASVAGGDRRISVLQIDHQYLNKGYKIRFETSVENQKYHKTDLEIPLTTAGLAAKADGTGYIRYVKLIKS